ncbi:MAG TPA: L,D-transpeptidase family protein [Flavitalea sp.]|nr:L,D-transpeptidase family protein [Flavitalea sp.]
MMLKSKYLFITRLTLLALLISCGGPEKPRDTDIVQQEENINFRIGKNLRETIDYAVINKGRINDSILVTEVNLVEKVYAGNGYKAMWRNNDQWLPVADSLFSFIQHSKEYGLFPGDYHIRPIQGSMFQLANDTVSAKNAALWTRADIMLTDALLLIAKHLKYGRLERDSVTLQADTIINEDIFLNTLNLVIRTGEVKDNLHALEPKLPGYDSLKLGLKAFLDSITFRRYTYLVYPDKDSLNFYKKLQKRFFESDVVESAVEPLDTAAWRLAISGYQKAKGLRITGKINETTVNSLNNTDWERFIRTAITLDRYKQLSDTMPLTYVWVNIPAFMLKVVDTDTTVFESRIIVGTTKTRTPLLTSQVSNFITYPQWTVPYSIIFKEMLPQIKRNVDYLAKQNLMIVDKNDSIIDPHTIDWSKLNKNRFPYLIKQRQGDDNSLGVLKFNFANKYSVYLHDTNARWMFSQGDRALSHGCVRVKDFQRLANFLVRNDTIKYHPDTLKNWIRRQEKHIVSGFPKVPVYIRYFSVEGKDGRIKFYPDIYSEDRILRNRYFADKAIM